VAAQRDWYEKDYYKVLGVKADADAKSITKAYRKLARESHPDTHPGDAKSEDRFKEVSAAYDVVGDESKRKEYDEVRSLGPADFGSPRSGSGGFNFNVGRSSTAAAAVAGHHRLQVRNAVPTSRRHSHWTSSMRPRVLPRLCISPPTRNVPRATAVAQNRARNRRCVRNAVVAEWSTITKDCFRCHRPAACAAVPASSSSIVAQRVAGPASSDGPARCKRAFPRALPMVSAFD